MKFPPSWIVVDIYKWLKDADNFATKATNSYVERNQTNAENVRRQTGMGKLCEFAFYEYVNSTGGVCTLPDTTRYELHERSYSPDLIVNGTLRVTAKGCDNNPASWIFQYNPNRDPIFSVDANHYDIFAGMCLLRHSKYVRICCILPVQVLHQHNLFSEPRKAHLAGIKKAIYMVDIERKLDDHFQISWSKNKAAENNIATLKQTRFQF